MHRNIVLVGFMGTGKTSVGRILAKRLGWTFVDSDHVIEVKAGQTIPLIFAERGEAAFRELETEALRELMAGEKQVVSTGGGAVLKEENRRLMLEGGLVAALLAEEAVIVERVRGDRNRPLLQGDVAERVRTLMAARREAYHFAPLQIRTDNLTTDQVADRIGRALQEG